jgi:hypothetical protein
MNWTLLDLPQLRTWRTDAMQARHDLMTGSRVSVWMDQNGERVEYNRANLPALLAYIASLDADIARLDAGIEGVAPRGPITFWM